MKPRTLLCLALLLAGTVAVAEDPSMPETMGLWQFALIRAVPGAPSLGEREIQRLQEQHLVWLRGLIAEDRIALFGPLDGGGELRSALVLKTESTEEARSILDREPWIAAGQRQAELHPWYSDRSVLRPPTDAVNLERAVLGLLYRPAGAPEYSTERKAEIQRGHMANIEAMAASGDLAVAGPMGDDGSLRGLFLFRTTDVEHLREAIANDAAVRAGRLEAKLYPWNVPAGALPPAGAKDLSKP